MSRKGSAPNSVRTNGEYSYDATKYSKIRTQQSNPELTEKHKLELKQAFGVCDPRGGGIMEKNDIKVALRALTYEPTFVEIERLIGKLPERKFGRTAPEGKFDFKDFFQLMECKMLEEDSASDLRKAFTMISDPNTGTIDLDNLQALAEELNADVTIDELKTMILCADESGTGHVDFNGFCKIMHKPKIE